MAADRRAIHHNGIHVYVPTCESCRTDEHVRLDRHWHPGAAEGFGRTIGMCTGCDRLIHASKEDLHALLEPQRLDDRLAQLRAGNGW